MKDQHILQDTLTDLREDIILLRLCLQGLRENAKGHRAEELSCLWRLSDYLEQHIGDVENLLQ